MTQDPPDEQDAVRETPDDAPEPETVDNPADGPPDAPAESSFISLDDLPPPPPQVELINDDDLSWLDHPEESEEKLERRRERREEHKRKVRRRRRLKKAGKIAGVLFATFLILGGIWFQWTLGGLERMPVAAGQAGLNTPGTTMLLVGSNPSEPDAQSTPGNGWKHDLFRSDMVMLLHLTRDNRSMFVISIPSRALLPIPGFGNGTLSQAFASGGEKLYVKTIEEYSGIRLDRIAVMDLNGLREITDVLDGVILDVPREACNIPPGPRRLDGQQALDFIALEPCLPRKDLDRVERQQSLLRALMRGAVDGGKVGNPFVVNKLLRSTASHLTLEKNYSYPGMFGTLWSMRRLRTTNTTFLTVPVAAQPNVVVDGVDVIRLDPAKDADLWDALRRDRLADYLTTNSDADVLE